MSVLLYKAKAGPFVVIGEQAYSLEAIDWDTLLNMPGLLHYLKQQAIPERAIASPGSLQAPIGAQELWGAGVTYFKSREARMQESRDVGGSDFYDRVYDASRPELFFKATAHRVSAPGGDLHLRRDSRWIVPEPELTLVINSAGDIIGYTIGNDLTCRDIESENPLYLPQAKTWDSCASIGPGLLIQDADLSLSTRIQLDIRRRGKTVCAIETGLSELKRTPAELVEYLTREASFPSGCFLMTGTGIVPDDSFSLESGDEVRITIEPIGTLINMTI